MKQTWPTACARAGADDNLTRSELARQRTHHATALHPSSTHANTYAPPHAAGLERVASLRRVSWCSARLTLTNHVHPPPCSGARADDKFTHSELVRALARRPEHAASKVLKELDISTKLK